MDGLTFDFRLLETVISGVWIMVKRAFGLLGALPEEARNTSFMEIIYASLILRSESKSRSNSKQASYQEMKIND